MWVGAGALGSNNGRVRLFFRDQAPALVAALTPTGAGGPPDTDPDRPSGPLHDALRARLWARGASFWPDLVAACAEAGLAYDDPTVLAALWDLVWAGEVTNDTLAPLRSHLTGRPSSRAAARGTARPRPGRLTRIGPPAGAGRWSLVSTLLDAGAGGEAPAPTPTEAAHALAWQLLERHGVVTREAVLAEGVPGGYAAVYPVLRALEERGQVRRGYFVSGLGAAQFALPGAVDRLRGSRATSASAAAGGPGGHRPRPALWRGARLARGHRCRPSRPRRRCPGGAVGRSSAGVPRARCPPPGHVCLARRRARTGRRRARRRWWAPSGRSWPAAASAPSS